MSWSVIEGIEDAASLNKSHQMTSWSEQSRGVIPLRSDGLKCVILSEIDWVSDLCCCDAKLCFHLLHQHPEAILKPFVSGTLKVAVKATLTVLNCKD